LVRPALFCAVFLAACAVCPARETMCLNNGFCIEAESHITENGRVVCRTAKGTLELPADVVASFSPIPADTVINQKVPQPSPKELVAHAARAQGLDAGFVLSVAKIESAFQTQAASRKGALGLMQLTPATAAALGVDPRSAPANAEGGARYLRSLLLRYRGDSVLALAAYNAGPGAVERFGGVPPYQETRDYVVKVLREYAREHNPAATRGFRY
jgi:hypothetical protein